MMLHQAFKHIKRLLYNERHKSLLTLETIQICLTTLYIFNLRSL